jgi:hypothetical protein
MGIAGSWFGSRERQESFCKEQANRSKGREMEAARTGLLSIEALQAWNQCQALSQNNVEIEVGDLQGELLSFTVRQKGDVPVLLTSVSFLGIAGCEVNGESIQSGSLLNREVKDGRTNIRCRRTVAPTTVGLEHTYERGEIGIDTNRGALDVDLARYSPLPPTTADELRTQLAGLEDRLKEEWPHGPYCILRVAEIDPGIWKRDDTASDGCPPGFNKAAWATFKEDVDVQVQSVPPGGVGPLDLNRNKPYDNLPLCCKAQ